MKILILCLRYDPAVGGVEQVVKQQAEFFSKKHIVEVHTTNLMQHKIPIKLKKYKYHEQYGNVNIYRHKTINIRIPGILSYPIIPGLFKILFKKKIDIIYAHSFWYFPAFAGLILSKIKRIPFVVQTHFDSKKGFINYFYKKTISKLLMKANLTIYVSEFEKELVKENKLYSPKSSIVYNSIKLEDFKDQQPLENIEFSPYISFLGRIDRGKGVDVLIKAVKILKERGHRYNAVIMGQDFGELPELRRTAESLGIAKNIIFLENKKRDEIYKYVKSSEVFVLPSRYEAFGIVLIEAMALKIPVIAADNSAMKYVVKDGVNGLLFKTDNPEELAQKIIMILSDNNLKNNLIKNAYQDVLNNYTVESSYIKLEQLLTELSNDI